MSFGPSPRVWGEPAGPVVVERLERTIPTRVGRTASRCRIKTLQPDHPHACGENREFMMTALRDAGPSPRVWGEPHQIRRQRPVRRTIPTRVGRTLK